jgi:hypothetical protein
MTGNILKITTLFFVLLIAENVSASEKSECNESGRYWKSSKCWSSRSEYDDYKKQEKIKKEQAKCDRKSNTHIMINNKCKPDPAKKAAAKLEKQQRKCERKADTHIMIDGKCKPDPAKKAARKEAKEQAKCEKKADTHVMIDGKCKKDPAKKEAAKLAKQYGIKIYTIGIGKPGSVPFPTQFGGYSMVDVPMDQRLLKEVAEMTGGQFFLATDQKALESIYRKINTLEKTESNQTIFLVREPLYYYPLGLSMFLLLILSLYQMLPRRTVRGS